MSVPISAASDDIDRRAVGALAALTAAAAATGLFFFEPDTWQGLLCVVVIGGTTYPLYSIAGAYANDWLPVRPHHGRRRPADPDVRPGGDDRPADRLGGDVATRHRRLRVDDGRLPPRDRGVPRSFACSSTGSRSVPSRGTRSRSPGGSSTSRSPSVGMGRRLLARRRDALDG